ncbi:MAG: V-type ATP synthase subunit D [Candidatus Ranarchaeia archaeon]
MTRIRWNSKPTRYDLLKLKKQLDLSKRAHHLLEEKQRLLLREYLITNQELIEKEIDLDTLSKNAFFKLSNAIIRNGIHRIRQAASDTSPNDELDVEWGMIKGVSVPILRPRIRRRKLFQRGYSFIETDFSLDEAVDGLEKLSIDFIEIAEKQSVLQSLEDEIGKTRIRVAALEQILIPSLNDEISRIQNLLNDMERQHLVTIKWIQENQQAEAPF